MALRFPTVGRASILILLTLSTSLNPEGAHTNRRANVLRDKPCGRANAEFLFPSILAADILHRPTGGILCAPCRRALPICASASKWNADIERRKDSQYGHADCARLPHIGAAILAKKPWLRLLCPACQQQGPVDLRKVVRPADDHIAGLYDALTCTFGPCHGDGPRPAMRGLFAGRDAPLAKPASEIA